MSIRNVTYVLNLFHNEARPAYHLVTGYSDALQAFALANEQADLKLLFQ